MSKRSAILSIAGAILVAAAPVLADSLSLITTSGGQSANDSIQWANLGPDATSLGASFPISSEKLLNVTCDLAGSGSLTAVVCPASPCSWGGVSSGMSAGDELLWTSDTGNGGNGPLTLTFNHKISGGGAFVQSDTPGQFTAQIQAFNGATSLGTVSEQSDANGDPIYIGVKDTSGPNIDKLVFSLTVCSGDCTDFGIDAVALNNNNPPPSPTPTPGPPTSTVLSYTPHKIAFPSEPFAAGTGAASAPVKVKVVNPKNKTDVPVVMNAAEIDDPGGDFRIDPSSTTCTDGFTLKPGASCAYGVIFQPTSVGLHSGELKINDNAHNAPQVVTLSGTGTSPNLRINVTEIVFGKVPVGVSSTQHTIKLTNKSRVPIAISGITPTDPSFTIAQQTCSGVLPNTPGLNSCTITVVFTPLNFGPVSAALVISDDALHQPQKIKLIGRGK